MQHDPPASQQPLRLLGVSGSMRQVSRGLQALDYALAHAAAHGAQTRLLNLQVLDLPMFQPDAPNALPAAAEARSAVEWADALIIASPDYHGSMSGAVKNFFDYHWSEFAGKLFGYICTSHEKGLTAMDQMRTAVRQCYGWSLPYGVSIHAEHDDLPLEAGVGSAELQRRLQMLARDTVVYGALIRQQFLQDQRSGAASFAARYR
jgi:NAD(P)H-dependent FMN reductase